MKLKPIPELQGDNPLDRLLNFFKQLGWSVEEYVDGTKVKLTREDCIKLKERELALVENIDERIKITMMWMNWGPSGSGQHPGKVELHKGWLRAKKGGYDMEKLLILAGKQKEGKKEKWLHMTEEEGKAIAVTAHGNVEFMIICVATLKKLITKLLEEETVKEGSD